MPPRPGGPHIYALRVRNPLRRARRGIHRLLGRKPEPTALRLEFSTPEQFASFVEDPRARRTYSRLEIRVDPWLPVRPDWSGRLGPLKGVTSFRADFDDPGRTASATVDLLKPVPAIALVRAAFPVFYPVRPQTGWGGYRVGILPGAAPDQRWHPGGGVRPMFPKKTLEHGITDFDIVIDAEGEHRITDPREPWVLLERPAAPSVLIDPKAHRPLYRRQPSRETVSAVASLSGGRFVVRAGDAVLIDTPAEESLTATRLRQLAPVTDIDCSAMGTGHLASVRTAELAAYGAVVHDASGKLDVHPDLLRLVSAPFQQLELLDHMNRSLAQVRAVMRNHTRVLTTRPLPPVSVILPTIRPDLLARILEQMAAQDYPNFEVVVGCHGFPAPARGSFPPHVQKHLGPMLEFGRDVIFGDVLTELTVAASGEFIAKIDDDDWYGPSHLTDLVAAWTYSEAQLVGKKLTLIHYEETDTLVINRLFLEGYRWRLAGGAAIIATHDLAAVGGWRSQVRSVDRGLWTRIEDAGGLSYSCSGPGYVYVRHAGPHTWTVGDGHFDGPFAEKSITGIPPAALGVLEQIP